MPGIVIATTPFLPMARSVAAALDYPDARVVAVDHPIAGLSEDAIRTKAELVVGEMIDTLLRTEGA